MEAVPGPAETVAAPEPVAYRVKTSNLHYYYYTARNTGTLGCEPLYTHPPAERVALLEESLKNAIENWEGAAETCSLLHKRIAVLEAELAKVREELEAKTVELEHDHEICNKLEAERDAAVQDAKRWRYVRKNPYRTCDLLLAKCSVNKPSGWRVEADAAIDAARKEGE